MTYLFPNLSNAVIEVWEWIRNFVLHMDMWLITMLGLKLNHSSKRTPLDVKGCIYILCPADYVFGSGHETVAVFLPGFAINW